MQHLRKSASRRRLSFVDEQLGHHQWECRAQRHAFPPIPIRHSVQRYVPRFSPLPPPHSLFSLWYWSSCSWCLFICSSACFCACWLLLFFSPPPPLVHLVGMNILSISPFFRLNLPTSSKIANEYNHVAGIDVSNSGVIRASSSLLTFWEHSTIYGAIINTHDDATDGEESGIQLHLEEAATISFSGNLTALGAGSILDIATQSSKLRDRKGRRQGRAHGREGGDRE